MSIDNKKKLKDLTLLLFFLSTNPGGPPISSQKYFALPVVSYLLSELFYTDTPVACTDGRMGVRSHDYRNFVDGWITKFS